MERNIVQIGNSMGVILPASILKRLNLSAKDPVQSHIGTTVLLSSLSHVGIGKLPHHRCMQPGDDNLIMPDILEDEKMEGLEW